MCKFREADEAVPLACLRHEKSKKHVYTPTPLRPSCVRESKHAPEICLREFRHVTQTVHQRAVAPFPIANRLKAISISALTCMFHSSKLPGAENISPHYFSASVAIFFFFFSALGPRHYDSITLFHDYSITVLLYYSITLLLYYSITLVLYYSRTFLLYDSITLLLSYSTILLLYYSFTLLLDYSIITLLLYYSTILLLYYSTTLLRSYSITLCFMTVPL